MFATMHLELGSITKLIDLQIIISLFFSKQKLDSAGKQEIFSGKQEFFFISHSHKK